MAKSFYFYDLETSGISPKYDRIMQFAGLRTNLDLEPIGDEQNLLIKMTDDVLPAPDAVMVTGITPQKTIAEGITEAEFLKLFTEKIATKDTVFVGFNTVRFDDEFMRYALYRNFYDPYEWQWQDGRSRWDLLDLVRMTRALRPNGIKWPFDSKGNPTNRLELLSSLNNLDHANAHDALSDVYATIAVARMIKQKQPKLFDFLMQMRDKSKVAQLVNSGQPFVYTSGTFASEFEKTTVVAKLVDHPQGQASMVYDLRYDPEEFLKLNPQSMAEAMRRRKDNPGPRLPAKTLKFNRCPAIAPLSVLDEASKERLHLKEDAYMQNFEKLIKNQETLSKGVLGAIEVMDKQLQSKLMESEFDVDAMLYDRFMPKEDKGLASQVQKATAETISQIEPVFKDDRFNKMLPLYKARNYPKQLSDEERSEWEEFRSKKLLAGGQQSRAAKFFSRLSELAGQTSLTKSQEYILEELQLYGQSILPEQDV